MQYHTRWTAGVDWNARRFWMRIAFTSLLLLLVAACQGTTADPDGTGPDTTQSQTPVDTSAEPDDGAEKTLVIADPATPPILDPDFAFTDQTWMILQNAYRSITDYEVSFEGAVGQVDLEVGPVGGLVESWDISDDGLTWTFKLRENVQDSDGHVLDTEDIKWSFERAIALEGSGRAIASIISIDFDRPIEIIDDTTFVMNLTVPNPIFPTAMAIPMANLAVFNYDLVSEHATDTDPWATEWLAENTAGYGPYFVETYSPGEQVIWRANPNYYGAEQDVDVIIWREVPDEATRLSLLKSGDVDIATFLGPNSRTEAADTDGLQVLSVPGNLSLIIGMNNEAPPLDDVAVRQAIAHAIPLEQIASTVYRDEPWAVPFERIVPRTYPFAQTDEFDYWPYDYNPERSRELLSGADFDGGTIELVINSTRPDQEQAAIIIRDALAEVGIDVDISQLTPARYQEQYYERRAQMVLVEDAPWVPDPGYSLAGYFSSSDAGFANWVNYHDDEAERLMQETLAEPDEERRFQLAAEANRIIVDAAPWAGSVGTGAHLVASERVGGYVWRPHNLLDFLYFTIDGS